MLEFYRQLLPEIAQELLTLTAILVGKHNLNNQRIALTPAACQTFAKIKQILAVTVENLRLNASL